MATVGVRDLKARLSEYLDRIEAGETVIITRHGRPVGRLVPEPRTVEERLEAMRRAGKIVWNGQRLPDYEPPLPLRDGASLSDMVLREREERDAALRGLPCPSDDVPLP